MKTQSLSIERQNILFNQILGSYKRNELITRKGLVELNGFRPATVTILISKLIKLDTIKEDIKTNISGPGRPEVCLIPNIDRFNAIFIYIDSFTFIASLVNIAGDVLNTISEELSDRNARNEDIRGVVFRLTNAILDSLSPLMSLCGITLSLPGIVDTKNKVWTFSNRWPQVRNISFDAISVLLGVEVNLVKNLNSELNAFIIENNELADKKILYIHWGEGIGAVRNTNHLETNDDGLFCELGQTLIDDGRVTLEQAASLASLRDELTEIFGHSSLNEQQCASLLMDQPIDSIPCVKNATEKFSLAVVNIYLILFPDMIILTGPFIQNKDIFELFKKHFFKYIPDYCGNNLVFKVNGNSYQNELHGSLHSFFYRYAQGLICGNNASV